MPATIISFAEPRRVSGWSMSFQELFGIHQRLSESTADLYFDTISEKLKTPEFLPRALYERFNLEVLATTDSPLDSLAEHQGDARLGLEGQDSARLPPRSGGRSGVCRIFRVDSKLGEQTGEDTSTWTRLSERAAQGARRFSRAGLHRNRPRSPYGANRRSARGDAARLFDQVFSRAKPMPRSRNSSAPRCSPKWRA